MEAEVRLNNHWLFPSEKVSYSNTPIINLLLTKGIQYFKSSTEEIATKSIDKRKTHYIAFDSDNKLRWYYQYEKDLLHDYKIIQQLIKNSTSRIEI